MLTMILLVFAFVCLSLAAFNVPTGRVNLGWLGMAFWCLSLILPGFAVNSVYPFRYEGRP